MIELYKIRHSIVQMDSEVFVSCHNVRMCEQPVKLNAEEYSFYIAQFAAITYVCS